MKDTVFWALTPLALVSADLSEEVFLRIVLQLLFLLTLFLAR
jgi:hypothetical protein